MGRPSVQKQRKAEVLDAFMTLVARFGVEGATLERIAEESGLKRPLIRHHLGNRDEMVRALALHVVEEQRISLENLRTALQDYPGLMNFVDALFSEDSETDTRLNNAYQALVMVVEQYPDLRQILTGVMAEFYALARQIVQKEYPLADPEDVQTVAHGVVDLYLTADALSPLNPPPDWRRSAYLGAVKLAQSLGSP